MPGKKQASPSLTSLVGGGVLGAITGAIWAFLRTWEVSADYFNRQGRGLVVIGVLLGWIPGLLAAIAGFAFGLWKGGKRGSIEGVLATLQGVERYIEQFETEGSASRRLERQRLELVPRGHSKVRVNGGHHRNSQRSLSKNTSLKKRVKIIDQPKHKRRSKAASPG